MLRPWLYAQDLIHLFRHFTSVENLRRRLKDLYPNLVELEKLASETGTMIEAPFQGTQIGAFFALAPSKQRFLELIVESDKTPEVVKEYQAVTPEPEGLAGLFKALTEYVAAKWGEEQFSVEATSAENEMSVVQYAFIAGKRILLTGDAGRAGLNEAADYLTAAGVQLPGIDVFQVPHHGSRRNVSTDVLDRLLGPRLFFPPSEPKFTAIVCASKEDEHHPRKAVVRACYHRGSGQYTHSTEEGGIIVHKDSPYYYQRGWGAAPSLPYPENQEA